LRGTYMRMSVSARNSLSTSACSNERKTFLMATGVQCHSPFETSPQLPRPMTFLILSSLGAMTKCVCCGRIRLLDCGDGGTTHRGWVTSDVVDWLVRKEWRRPHT